MTYQIAVHNAGPSNADVPLTVVDTLPAGLTYVSAASPWTCTAGTPGAQDVTCTYSPADQLATGADAPDLLLTAQIDAAAPAGTYTNSATVSSPTPDPTPANNTDTDDLLGRPLRGRVDRQDPPRRGPGRRPARLRPDRPQRRAIGSRGRGRHRHGAGRADPRLGRRHRLGLHGRGADR